MRHGQNDLADLLNEALGTGAEARGRPETRPWEALNEEDLRRMAEAFAEAAPATSESRR